MRIGLSSYTYTWAIGVPGYPPRRVLTLFELLERAGLLGVAVLQVADNLPLHELPEAEVEAFGNRARELGIAIEVGTRGIDPENLTRYVRLARELGSSLVRVVIAREGRDVTPDEAVAVLRSQRAKFDRAGLVLAIENHDKFSTDALVDIVQRLGTEWSGICLDTVNSLGALEGPAVVVEKLSPLAVNLHVKDFVVRRAKHMMGFEVEGRPIGDGQLNVPWLIESLGGRERAMSAIVELWTPPGPSLEATIDKEREWAVMSVRNLRKFLSA